MRVLEKEIVSSYSMGKKNKHKLRKSKDNDASDSSEDVSAKGCSHVNKAVNVSAMKKGLAKQTFGECNGCAKDVARKGEPKTLMDHLEGATSSDYNEEVDTTLWICLQCGNQGCGRMSKEKHALKHYETPRSTQHTVVINTANWSAWCYDCDDELLPEKYKKVAECMEHIKKLACVPAIDTSIGKNSNGGIAPSTDQTLNKGRPPSAKATSAGCNKVKGLSNLGNTCFFNAVMQNLVQTYSLENLLCDRRKGHPLKLQGHPFYDLDSCSSSDEADNDKKQKNLAKDLSCIEISVSDPGPLTQALVVFLHDINTTSRSGCINPSALFGQVCKKAPRFKGMQQQDSHELLRYLLDNMKTEEIKRGQSGILKFYKLSENTNPKKVDEDTKYKVKVFGQEIKHTFVECLFGGQLISTVVCEECKYISQVLEPFLDLSLPVTEEKPQRPNQLHGGRKKEVIAEPKEDTNTVEGSQGVKEDKVSKHQTKKQKKRQKRDSRRHSGKNKGCAEEEGEKGELDGQENEDNDKDGEKEGQTEEKWEDSDADVEDNLESDTSRCYKSLSDSAIITLETPEKVVASSSEIMDISNYRLDAGEPSASLNSTFNVETNVENHHSLKSTHTQSTDSGLVNSSENGPMKTVDTELDNVVDVNVSYTFTNGHLSEIPASSSEQNVENCVDTKFTFSCPATTTSEINGISGICNGVHRNSSELQTDVKTCDDDLARQQVSPLQQQTVENHSALVNGDLKFEYIDADENDCIDADLNSGELNGAKVTTGIPTESSVKDINDVASEISTLSLGGSTSTLASDLSQLTLKDEDDRDVDAEKPDISPNQTTSGYQTQTTTPASSKTCNGTSVHLANGDIATETQLPTGQHKAPASQNSKLVKIKELYREGKKKSVNTLSDRYHPSSGECSLESCLHQFTAAELLTGNNKFGCKNCTKLKYKNNPNKEKKETVYSNANKQYLIFQPPAVLTLHLKRFEQVGFSSRKVNRHVDFPFTLDIAPYCSSLSQGIKYGQKKMLYSLYGVVEHSGRLTSGHYTAYVKVRANIGTLNNFLNKHNVSLKEYLNTYAHTVLNNGLHDNETADDINTDGLVPPGRWYHISDSRVNEVTEASVERAQAYLLFYERIY